MWSEGFIFLSSLISLSTISLVTLKKTFTYEINWTDLQYDGMANILWYHNILIFEDNLPANSQISFKVYSPTV